MPWRRLPKRPEAEKGFDEGTSFSSAGVDGDVCFGVRGNVDVEGCRNRRKLWAYFSFQWRRGFGGGSNADPQVSQTARDKTLARLKRIIIPALEFRQANLKDVLNFMVEASIAADPVKEGVNVVFKERRLEDGVEPRPASPGTRLADRSEPEDEWGIIGEAGECPPVSKGNVTMNLRRISLYDAMETVAEVAGVKWRITDGGVVFVEDTHPTEEDSLENN